MTSIREEVESIISESEALMNYALCLSTCQGTRGTAIEQQSRAKSNLSSEVN